MEETPGMTWEGASRWEVASRKLLNLQVELVILQKKIKKMIREMKWD